MTTLAAGKPGRLFDSDLLLRRFPDPSVARTATACILNHD